MRWLFIFSLLFIVSCSLYESDARKFLREQGVEYRQSSQLSLNSQRERHCGTSHLSMSGSIYDMNYEVSHEGNITHLDFKHSLPDNNTLAHCRFTKFNSAEFSESESLEIEQITQLHVEVLIDGSTKEESHIN